MQVLILRAGAGYRRFVFWKLLLPQEVRQALLGRDSFCGLAFHFLKDEMNHRIGTIYHILLSSQYGMWTLHPNPFIGSVSHMFLDLCFGLERPGVLGYSWELGSRCLGLKYVGNFGLFSA